MLTQVTPIGTVILSIPQGLICSKKVAISDMTIISIVCRSRLLIEEIVAELIATTEPIVNVPTIDFDWPSIVHFGELIDFPIKPASPSPKAIDRTPIEMDDA